MTLKLVLDRFEEDIAVCLDFNDKSHLIPREILSGVKVNDIFNIEFDGNTYHDPKVLSEETKEAKESISKRMNRLFKIAKNRRFPK
jgi:hypothetical protein